MADASPNQEGSSTVPPTGPVAAPPIRTMKDDLASPAAAPSPSPLPANQALDISANRPLSSTALSTEQPLFPAQPRKKRTGLIITIAIVILAALGGVAAWVYFMDNKDATVPVMATMPSPTTGTALDVIPANSNIVLHYNLSQTTFRERISRAWEQQSSDTPIANLLSGNPSHLLLQADVSEIMYVSLPNDPRPYLLVPKSASTDQLVAQQTEEQAKEINGWYVLHPLSVASYMTALGQGNITTKIEDQPLSTDFPLHFIASTQFLTNTHEDISLAYPNLSNSQHLTLNGQISATGKVALLTNDKLLVGVEENASNDLNIGTNSLYKYVPSDANFVWQGQDASEDLNILAQSRGLIIDNDVLQKLPVNTFIKKLTAPYIYYERLGGDSVKDFGLIIDLPDTVQSGEETLELGDENLEAALQAFIPRITGQPAAGSLAFNDGSYSGVALKFVNLVGTTQALDYAFQDGHLIIATSKEGIARLIDTVSGNSLTIEDSSPWSPLIIETSRVSPGRIQIFTSIADPLLSKILPLGQEAMPVIVQSGFLETAPLRIDAAFGWAGSATAAPQASSSPNDASATPQPFRSEEGVPSPAASASPQGL